MDNKTETINAFDSIEILNLFLKIYNKKYRRVGNMFENIDIKDPLSTNDKTELFYEYMTEHNNLFKQNISMTDVFEPDMYMENKNNNDIYALLTDTNKKLIYKSFSYISLLFIGYKNITENTEWSIVKL